MWSGRGDHDKAYQLLEKAKELHAGFLHSKEPPPKAYDEIFMDEVQCSHSFITSLFYYFP